MGQFIPVGSTLARVYYAVRTNAYTTGEHYDDWDAAVTAAKAAFDARVTSLAATLPYDADVRATAKTGVYMETRWTMDHPDSGSTDFMFERHADVTALRTRASFAA